MTSFFSLAREPPSTPSHPRGRRNADGGGAGGEGAAEVFGRSRGGGRTEKGDGFEGLPRAAQQGCTTQGGLSSGGGEMTTPRSGSWSKEWRHEAGEDCAPATLGLDGDADRQGWANRARGTHPEGFREYVRMSSSGKRLRAGLCLFLTCRLLLTSRSTPENPGRVKIRARPRGRLYAAPVWCSQPLPLPVQNPSLRLGRQLSLKGLICFEQIICVKLSAYTT